MERGTSYGRAYNSPPEDCSSRNLKENKHHAGAPQGTLTSSHEPMQRETTSMKDFKAPGVETHKSVGPPPGHFGPPNCSMETETTSGLAYPEAEHNQNQYPINHYPDPGPELMRSHLDPSGPVRSWSPLLE